MYVQTTEAYYKLSGTNRSSVVQTEDRCGSESYILGNMHYSTSWLVVQYVPTNHRSLLQTKWYKSKLSGTNRSSVVQIEAQWYKPKTDAEANLFYILYCNKPYRSIKEGCCGTMGVWDYGPGSISLLTTPKIQASYCRKCVP
jgi:hypothetical protein